MKEHVKKILDGKTDEELRNYVHYANELKGKAHGKRKDLHPKVHKAHHDNSHMSAENKTTYDNVHGRVRDKMDIVRQHVAAVREYLQERQI